MLFIICILSQQYFKLFNILYNNCTNITALLYMFFTNKDKSLFKFIINEFIPRFMKLPSSIKNQETQFPDICISTIGIEANIKKDIESKFYDIIIKYKGIISGSYIVKHITNGKWCNNDIDIYLPLIKNTTEFIKELKSIHNTFETDNNNKNFENFSKYKTLQQIAKVINATQQNGIKLQFIFTLNDPIDFIKENFDLSFCKFYYNPAKNTLGCDHPNINNLKSGCIEKSRLEKMLNLTMKQNTYEVSKIVSRIIKYSERGFNITNIDDFVKFVDKLLETQDIKI